MEDSKLQLIRKKKTPASADAHRCLFLSYKLTCNLFTTICYYYSRHVSEGEQTTYKYETDSELVALARKGDKHAFGQLIERYTQMVKRIAIGKIANEEVARELVQETFLQAYLSLSHLRDDARFKSWLYGITLNVCRSYLRERKASVLSLEI